MFIVFSSFCWRVLFLDFIFWTSDFGRIDFKAFLSNKFVLLIKLGIPIFFITILKKLYSSPQLPFRHFLTILCIWKIQRIWRSVSKRQKLQKKNTHRSSKNHKIYCSCKQRTTNILIALRWHRFNIRIFFSRWSQNSVYCG